ncbi:MAG: adenylate/guanylate cyclase domain-containing response regulator, partial [Verrucomicrobia bacterium]
DYVTKPFKSEEVLMRVETHVKIHNLTRALEGSNGELAARNSELQSEKKRSDDLLHIILPHEVAEELKATSGVKPRRFENVGVLFCDIVGFTGYCDRHAPEEIVDHLQALVEAFEGIAGAHGLEKIKTIGDSFMAAAGLAGPVANPALQCVACGLAMIAKARELAPHWELRVGVQVGPVIAGVVGRRKYQYDVWGDAVNTAARLENAASAGSVCVTTSAWRQVADHCEGTHQGSAQIKGKGELDLYRIDRLRVPLATA